jgi:hypothetical protein
MSHLQDERSISLCGLAPELDDCLSQTDHIASNR